MRCSHIVQLAVLLAFLNQLMGFFSASKKAFLVFIFMRIYYHQYVLVSHRLPVANRFRAGVLISLDGKKH